MERPSLPILCAAAAVGAVALLATACDLGGIEPSAAAGPRSGGTITILTQDEGWDWLDPQRLYGGEGMAFFGATIYRSLVSYADSPDAAEANLLKPDMATDTGTANADATEWTFTLRDGLTFQDGSPITCEDVAYGTSRTFATNVIIGGPNYQIRYLDIPFNDDGSSQYPGPYTATPEQQAMYDRAVSCDGNTITFRLNQPVVDFRYTTTLGFIPVPRAADTGETYGDHPVSSGPYQVESYEPGVGGKLVLVRNPNWHPASDPVRKAYPDTWEIDFGLDPLVIDQRLMGSRGSDAFAVGWDNIQPVNMAEVFADPQTPNLAFEGRAASSVGTGVYFYWVDVQKVPNVKIRQAMAAALDRSAIRLNAGGAFAGDLADGLISPSLGSQYAPTGLWDGLLGQPIPASGDPAYARQLIAESGEAAPRLTWDFPSTPTRNQEAAIVKASLEGAGFTVDLNPVPLDQYAGVLFARAAHEFGWGVWAPDWPSASTIIPPLTTPTGDYAVSRVCDPACGAADDPDWRAKVDAALAERDPTAQARKWQDLNREAMDRVFEIPTIFARGQALVGSKVKPVFNWAPFGTWPYAELYVIQ